MRFLRFIGAALLLIGLAPLLLAALLIALPLVAMNAGGRAYQRTVGGSLWHWFRSRMGWGLSVARLAQRLDLPVDELREFVPDYRSAFIPKRSGGTRRLRIPDRRTLDLQRRLLRRIFGRLKAHPAATGFERSRSIVDNARPHVRQAVVIKLDVEDFFTNTTADRLRRYFQRIGWNAEAAELLTRLTTDENGLPQGAPTSPRLSNLVNYILDVRLTRLARRWKGQYTRYADDITFSFPKDYPRHVRGVIQKAGRILKGLGYRLNHGKVRILRAHQRQTVTGLVVNDRVRISRRQRRLLRAVEHHLRTGRDATLNASQLEGWQAFIRMVDGVGESPLPGE